MSDEDCDAVAEFIRSRGITRCPTACVLPTQGVITAADRIALEQYAVARDRVRQERAAVRWRFLTLTGLLETYHAVSNEAQGVGHLVDTLAPQVLVPEQADS
jgi:hypothetical protein